MIRSLNRAGGLIDTESKLSFTFNNKKLIGYKGDTLASALIANGQKIVGRSFKYHRPRGIFSLGSEEPNALVQLGNGSYTEPNVRSTTVELFQGLEARSQNHQLSLEFDLMAVNDFLSPFLMAGFYYKTFMWPKSFWEIIYEPLIRAAAGPGKLSMQPHPDCYDKGFIHCDLLIVGAGATGLSAALVAGRSGARVVIADEDFLLGGRLNFDRQEINGLPGSHWADEIATELDSIDNVRLMRRTTVFGSYDNGVFGALESRTDYLNGVQIKPRQIFWRIVAKRSLICTGATERSIAFPSNDRPNVMLANAARGYLNRYGASTGQRLAIFTNNDSGWQTANDYARKGIDVPVIIDTRNSAKSRAPAGSKVNFGGSVIATKGRLGLSSIKLSDGQKIYVDCLAVSGGWNPNLHLTCHKRNYPIWKESIAAFIPGSNLDNGMRAVGAANGSFDLSQCLKEGLSAGKEVVRDIGFTPAKQSTPQTSEEMTSISAFWHVTQGRGRSWLDLQNDVTVKDVELAVQEGFYAVEQLKRYTTLGMAPDQGKTSNVLALAILASKTGKSIEETGTTVYRPPYNPVAIGAFAGRSRGKNYRPYRHTPSHSWAKSNGAIMVEAGNWLRAQWFALEGETDWRQSVDREVITIRNKVGICDVSTLGKIDIQGRDANEFLNRVYANGFKTLAVGRVRYGLMLREDGIAYDDGTVARLDNTHYLMTTTTAKAALVYRHLEFANQCLWPGLDVQLISVTDAWAQFAVAGPNSRDLICKLIDPKYDLSNIAFPFMACGEITVCGGVNARLFRISFSGELAYEIAVPSRYGNSMMEALMEAGQEFGVTPYGTESLNVMRIEKGHASGNELNGQTTARQLGLGQMVSRKKDCIGNVLSQRLGMNRDDDLRLMGFIPVDHSHHLTAGAHFFDSEAEINLDNDLGWMSSVAYSPNLGHFIGLGFIKFGEERLGDKLVAVDAVRGNFCDVEIVSPNFIDPEGERLHG